MSKELLQMEGFPQDATPPPTSIKSDGLMRLEQQLEQIKKSTLPEAVRQKLEKCSKLSLASRTVQDLTLKQATHPTALSLAAVVRVEGRECARALISKYLMEADLVCGGKTNEDVLVMIANMILRQYIHRSVASVMMALRDGVGSTDKDGKVYGQISWPTVALWLERHEEAIAALAADEHSRTKFVDNVGKDYLDRRERESKDGTIRRQERLITQLRNKLSNK